MAWMIFDRAMTIGDGEMIGVVAIELIVLRVGVVLMALKTLMSWVPIGMSNLLLSGS